MKPRRRCAAVAFVLGAGLSSRGCECAEREPYDVTESTGVTSLEATTANAMTTMGMEATSRSTDDTADVSPFLGIFHNENQYIPFGRETTNPSDPSIANVEILPDGTATMTMETCNEDFGPLAIAWRWAARTGPWLEFTPGPGEESLRFMVLTDLASLRATIDDDCGLQFEIDGEPLTVQTFRRGKACWVNRCEPSWTVHIDYCEGEEPPPCE
jgi:hypothetical protein